MAQRAQVVEDYIGHAMRYGPPTSFTVMRHHLLDRKEFNELMSAMGVSARGRPAAAAAGGGGRYYGVTLEVTTMVCIWYYKHTPCIFVTSLACPPHLCAFVFSILGRLRRAWPYLDVIHIAIV